MLDQFKDYHSNLVSKNLAANEKQLAKIAVDYEQFEKKTCAQEHSLMNSISRLTASVNLIKKDIKVKQSIRQA